MNKKTIVFKVSDEHKSWIDNASYYELLKRWRFSENDNIFQGITGTYYADVMNIKKRELSINEQVRISKLIGWSGI